MHLPLLVFLHVVGGLGWQPGGQAYAPAAAAAAAGGAACVSTAARVAAAADARALPAVFDGAASAAVQESGEAQAPGRRGRPVHAAHRLAAEEGPPLFHYAVGCPADAVPNGRRQRVGGGAHGRRHRPRVRPRRPVPTAPPFQHVLPRGSLP